MQVPTIYKVPVLFLQQFKLDNFAPKFQLAFPSFNISYETTTTLEEHHFTDLKKLLEALKEEGREHKSSDKAEVIKSLSTALAESKKNPKKVVQPKVSKEKAPTPIEAPNPAVLMGLNELNKVSKILSDPSTATLQSLLDLSWGIGRLPKENKFSKYWCSFLTEHHWLLLEDIARQVTALFPAHPELSYEKELEARKLLNQFASSARVLQAVFEKISSSELPPDERVKLPEVDTLFKSGFDQFVLRQMEKAIQVVIHEVGTQEPVEWLKQAEIHTKALFRLVEIIGEASKLLSKSMKRLLPTLLIGNDPNGERSFWGKLRNLLHHNKSRTWDIASLAPERWADVLRLLPQLMREITQPSVSLQPNEEASKKLETLYTLCEQDYFGQIRSRWNKIKDDFKLIPMGLLRILFGIDAMENVSFHSLWDTHAKPFLKSDDLAESNRQCIFELLRLLNRNEVTDFEIDQLDSKKVTMSIGEALIIMKGILRDLKNTTDAETKKKLIQDYRQLADQFVFLKDPKTNFERDLQKNEELKAILSHRVDQISPLQISEAMLRNPGGSPNHYAKLLQFFILFKQSRIKKLMTTMRQALSDLAKEWDSVVVTAGGLQTLKDKAKPKFSPKGKFTDCLHALINEKELLPLPPSEELKSWDKKLVFPSSDLADPKKIKLDKETKKGIKTPADLETVWVQHVQTMKRDCLEACGKLTSYLDAICFDESLLKKQVYRDLKNYLYLARDLFLNTNEQEKIEREAIIRECQFDDLENFKQRLEKQGLKDLIQGQNVNEELEKQNIQLLEKQLDALTEKAERHLSTPFVQSTLRMMSCSLSDLKNRPRAISRLREIYATGREIREIAWENIERKMEGKKLSAEDYRNVCSWLHDKPQKIERQLLAFMNGYNCFEDQPLFDYGKLPRYAHNQQKLDTFKAFLSETCFVEYPLLKEKEVLLLDYFKIAYGIKDAQKKVKSFADLFIRKLEKLRSLFSKIRLLESLVHPESSRGIALMAAEYDMQDLGELAQLITERPALWNNRGHILSWAHFGWMGLMRKMMAHYPLILAPEVIRWNVEFLAFDTANVFLRVHFAPPVAEEKTPVQQASITGSYLRQHMFEIENHLDRLNLKVECDVLYPSLHEPDMAPLHPFGGLTLLVYPATGMTKAKFIHATMEFELILSHQLKAKVNVMGEWQGELVNIPTANTIPQGYLLKLIRNKQPIGQWVISTQAHDLFRFNPWSQVIFQGGKNVLRSKHEWHKALVSFFQFIGVESKKSSIDRFIETPGLEFYICERLNSEREKAETRTNYSESRLFNWICCLFERFCPVEVTPNQLISLPKLYGHSRPQVYVVDNQGKSLRFLPENQNNNEVPGYYRQGKRLDIVNGRSLLDPKQPIQQSELRYLADYAAEVLRDQKTFILDVLAPENGLEPTHFCRVEKIVVADPMLVEETRSEKEITSSIRSLIQHEAQTLTPLIIDYVRTFRTLKGSKYCELMLDCMAIDKMIEVRVKEYYIQHRRTLREPYIQMDPIARNEFDEHYILNRQRDVRFQFVNSFRGLLERVHDETQSFTVEANGEIHGDLSDYFKSFVTDPHLHQFLVPFLKRRKGISKAIEEELKTLQMLPEYLSEFIRQNYLQWNYLFRMTQGVQLFRILKEHLNTGFKPPCDQLVQVQLIQDWENQYKHPCQVRENSTVKKSKTEECQLYEAREYFDGKLSTQEAKEEHIRFLDNLKKLSLTTPFHRDWLRIFGTGPQCYYYSDLIVEAREALNYLLSNMFGLPDHNFDDVSTYSQYWNFILTHSVTMVSTYMSSGLSQTFKSFIQQGGTLGQILQYPEKKKALEENPRLYKLIKAYIPFCRYEFAYSDWQHYLEEQIKKYKQHLKEKEEAIRKQLDPELIKEFEERMKLSKDSVRRGLSKLEEILPKLFETKFFKMLTWWVRRENIVKKGADLTPVDQTKCALEVIHHDENLLKEAALILQS